MKNLFFVSPDGDLIVKKSVLYSAFYKRIYKISVTLY